MFRRFIIASAVSLLAASPAALLRAVGQSSTPSAEQPSTGESDSPDQIFVRDVQPLLQSYCIDCHNQAAPEAELSFDQFETSAEIQNDENFIIWQKALKHLLDRSMPPEESELPTETERLNAASAIEKLLSTFDCGTERKPGRVTIRRLNRPEYNNTIRDLVGLDLKLADGFPADDVGEGFDNIGDVLAIPPLLMEKYLAAAETIVDKLYADPEALARVNVAQAGDAFSKPEAARKNLVDFMTRAFRRPPTEEEVNRHVQLFFGTMNQGLPEADAAKLVYQAILSSPNFLFRIEHDPTDDDKDGITALNDYEIATRLSYFLWSSMPDAELFRLADEGKLRDPEVLGAQVDRMLADDKSQALVDNFAGQWLQLRDLIHLSPDPDKYPGFDDELRVAMQRETQLFFAAILKENRSVLDFLTADFSYINERLAKHYGINGIEGNEFRRVQLPEQRRGVLTQASILLITSNPTRTSPVKRGKWILDNILGEPPPPPPAGVEELPTEETLGSLRERMEQHRSNEACAVCHRRMDVLGFGLENFDGVGAWRDQDGKFAIDPSGSFPGGGEFSGPKDLMRLLKDKKSEEFCRCLTTKLLTYGLGRGLKSADRCAVDQIMADMAKDEYRFAGLIKAIVLSDPFLYRAAAGDQ